MSFRDSEREPEGDELRFEEESSLRDSSPSDFSDTSASLGMSSPTGMSSSSGMKAPKPRRDGASSSEGKTSESKNPEGKSPDGKSRKSSRRKTREFSPAVNGYRGDYRSYLGYAGSDYRDTDIGTGESDAQIDWAAALWRYRYAMILPVLVGIACAGAYFTTQPSVFRSTARLVVESETSWAPDARDENATSAVPPSELLLMQLRSEQVIDHAASHPLLADAAKKMSPQQLRYVLADGVQFQDAMTKSRSDRALAFFLHFDSEDPVFAVHAVSAISDGLQHFFAERSETSVSELKQLITTAKDKLMPELNSLEAEYRKFQENTELTFDKSGEMVNPYREKQLALQGRRLSIEDDMRDLTTKLSAIHSTMQSSTDPMLVMEVVHQLLGEELFAVRKLVETESGFENGTRMPPMKRDEDLSLAKLTIERTLLPMEVERQQFASSFGTGHPSVRQLDQQISATREKLNELTAQENRRLMELKKEELLPSDELMKVRRERAEMAVGGFVKALETRRAVLETQLEMLDEQVTNLSDQATKLTRAESENAMYLRRIGRAQKLLDNVEEQMTKINLADQKASIHVSQLNPPSPAGLVAPILSKYLLVGGMLGGMLGLGLVYLLESQSKTFRSSEEVSRFLGIRVLSHVPTDTRTLPKMKKGEKYPFASIDPGLASIHRPRSTTAEAVRRLRTSVFLEAAAAEAKVIQVTSALPGDGKSTLSGNLGISIARSGKTVVIVDADLRLPQMTASFSMSDKDGLTDLIDGTCDPSQVVHSTPIENLWIVPCGPIPTNPAEALSMSQFNEFLGWLKERYDYVIVDTPPLLVVTDPSIVASAVDGVVFTFRIRRGSKPQSKEAISMLRAIGTPIFGAVINRVDQTTKASGYQGYHTSSYYKRRYHSSTPASNGVASAGDLSGEGRLVNPRPTKTVGDAPAKFDRLVKVEE